MELILEAVKEHWGDRCPDHHPDCYTCRAWDEFDALAESYSDLRDLAARYDALLMHLNTVQAERDAARVHEEAVHD